MEESTLICLALVLAVLAYILGWIATSRFKERLANFPPEVTWALAGALLLALLGSVRPGEYRTNQTTSIITAGNTLAVYVLLLITWWWGQGRR